MFRRSGDGAAALSKEKSLYQASIRQIAFSGLRQPDATSVSRVSRSSRGMFIRFYILVRQQSPIIIVMPSIGTHINPPTTTIWHVYVVIIIVVINNVIIIVVVIVSSIVLSRLLPVYLVIFFRSNLSFLHPSTISKHGNISTSLHTKHNKKQAIFHSFQPITFFMASLPVWQSPGRITHQASFRLSYLIPKHVQWLLVGIGYSK